MATNFWFGSPLSEAFTSGTAALAELFSTAGAVARIEVDCDVPKNIEHEIDHFRDYRAALRRVRGLLSQRNPLQVVNLGGGCAAEIAVLPYLLGIHPDLQVVWIDAHFDLNLPATSRSHYIHGMTVGILTDPPSYGLFFEDSRHFEIRRFLFIGQKSWDRYERQLIERHGAVSIAPTAELTAALDTALTRLNDRPVHIHLDLDVLRPELYPNPKCDISDGLRFADVSAIVSAVQRTSKVVGYTIAENPETDGAKVREVARIFIGLPQ